MQLGEYQNKYSTIQFARSDGVLEMTLHTRGGEAKWGLALDSLHNELGEAFADLARDPENKVVLLTGTGDNFLVDGDLEAPPPEGSMDAMWPRIFDEGMALLHNLLAVPVPVVAAVNGPAFVHAEIPVLSDIVLAAEHAEFADLAHFRQGRVPGDGSQTVWPMLLGPNRGRVFLLTGQRIGAEEAQRLGIVAEVVSADRLMARAREVAQDLAQQPYSVLRHTRSILVRELRRRMQDELGLGLGVEVMAALSDPAV